MKILIVMLLGAFLLLSACSVRPSSDNNSGNSVASELLQNDYSTEEKIQNDDVESELLDSSSKDITKNSSSSEIESSTVEDETNDSLSTSEIGSSSSSEEVFNLVIEDSANEEIYLEIKDGNVVNDVIKYLNDVEEYYEKVSPPTQWYIVNATTQNGKFSYKVWIDSDSVTPVKVANENWKIWSIKQDSSEAIKSLFPTFIDVDKQTEKVTCVVQVSLDQAILWESSESAVAYKLYDYLNDIHQTYSKVSPPTQYYNVLIISQDLSSEYKIWLNLQDDSIVMVADSEWNIWSISGSSSTDVIALLEDVL